MDGDQKGQDRAAEGLADHEQLSDYSSVFPSQGIGMHVTPVSVPGNGLNTAGSDRVVDEATAQQPISRRNCVLNHGGCVFRVADNEGANGLRPNYEATRLSTVAGYARQLDEAAKIYGVDPRLLRSIMYMEETHGYYDEPLRWFDLDSSIRPMNINTDYWGDSFGTRHELRYAEPNIRASANLLSRIVANMPKDASIPQVATVYNDLHATKVNDYGARVSAIYNEQPWLTGK